MGDELKGVSLRGLEVFEALAQTGSVGGAADRLGMSAPAVSQQLKNLNSAVGLALVEQSKRPMTLTPAGRQFLRRVDIALNMLRMGQRDLNALDLSGISALRLGVIEDLENLVTPTLTARLAGTMRNCAFRLHTAPSHTLIGQVERRELDFGICAIDRAPNPGVVIHPLLTDPYILAVPRGTDVSGGIGSLEKLIFLRRDSDQVMGQQIEDALQRQGFRLPHRFEMDSNQSISALVASGRGWTITTPLSLLRAERFGPEIDAHPLPFEGFSRRIALCVGQDWTGPIPMQIAGLARDLIEQHFVTPGCAKMPWLADWFRRLDG